MPDIANRTSRVRAPSRVEPYTLTAEPQTLKPITSHQSRSKSSVRGPRFEPQVVGIRRHLVQTKGSETGDLLALCGLMVCVHR